MELDKSLLKEFAQITNDSTDKKQNIYLRGTIVTNSGNKYVQIDGSSTVTPISEIVNVEEGDRVLVSIENHKATIIGNFTFTPSARKEQEAIDKADSAKTSADNVIGIANEAQQKAEEALTKANSAQGATEEVLEAVNTAQQKAEEANNNATTAMNQSSIASASAAEAKEQAAEALESATTANNNITEAKNLATQANTAASEAKQQAAASQVASAEAQAEVTRLQGEVTEAQEDIDGAITQLQNQANEIAGVKKDYATKVEVGNTKAELETTITEKVGELETTISQSYSTKTENVELEGRLQSQITQNAQGLTSQASMIEQLEADTTEAQKDVADALSKANAAQTAASQAQTKATNAQTAADQAKTDAANAAEKATIAQNAATAATNAANAADQAVQEAQNDLNEAKQNLANVTSRVDATEADIAEAQAKVDAAQADVNEALADAAEANAAATKAQNAANKAQQDAETAQGLANTAQTKANNAQTAADNAQAAADQAAADVAALTKRVTTAETTISQNSENIILNANKTEEIGNKLDNLKIGGRNLALKTNQGKTNWSVNIYNGTTSTEEYLDEDGIKGVKIVCDAISSNWHVVQYRLESTQLSLLKENTNYVVSFDIKSNMGNGNIWLSIEQTNGKNVMSTNGKGSINGDETWEKLIIPITTIADFSTITIGSQYLYFTGFNKVGYAIIKNLKFEEGTINTAWTPAPEDIENELTTNYYTKTETDAKIKVESDRITSTVSKVETIETTISELGSTEIAEGVDISVDSSNNPAKLTVYGKSEQETRSGKNILNYVDNFKSSGGGLTSVLNEDGSITTTGVPTGNYVEIIKLYDLTDSLSDGKTYIISQNPSTDAWIEVRARDASTNAIKTYYGAQGGTSKFTVDKSLYTYDVRIISGTTANWGTESKTITNFYQIEEGSTATGFEKYGASPSPDFPSEVKTISGIKNVFDGLVEHGSYDQTTGEKTTNAKMLRNINPIHVKPKTEYIFGINGKMITESPRFFFYDKQGILLSSMVPSSTSVGGKFKTPDNCYYVNFHSTNLCTNYGSELPNPMIEEGSVAHNYVPYGAWGKVRVTGKNMLDVSNINSSNGIISAFNDDGSLTINGTASTNWSNVTSRLYKEIPAGTYTFSIVDAKSIPITLRIYYEDDTYNNYSIAAGSKSVQITLTKKAMSYYMYIWNLTSGTVYNDTFYLQLEEGSTVTEFEPYQEQELLVDLNKPNLFDSDNANILNGYLTADKITGDQTSSTLYIECKPNTTYTASRSKIGNRFRLAESSTLPVVGGAVSNPVPSSYNNSLDAITITTSSSAKYLLLFYSNTGGENLVNNNGYTEEELRNNITIYESNNSTPYYELCSINDIEDELTIENGQTILNKKIGKIILNGSQTLVTLSNGNNNEKRFKYTNSDIKNIPNNILGCISNKYRGVIYNDTKNTPNSISVWNEQNMFCITTDSTTKTVTELTTELQNDPASVYYESSKYKQITLQGDYDLSTFKGKTHVYLVDDLEPSNMVLEYYPNTSYNDSLVNKDSFNGSITDVQNGMDNRLNDVNISIQKAQSAIDQLSNMISHLVTDANGGSLMTQTSDGWTFNMSAITSNLETIKNELANMDTEHSDTNNALTKLTSLVNDVVNKTAYITMSTDENNNPCIELGKTDNQFKVRITNTAIDFLEGSTKIAYVNNNTFYTEKLIVKNELQIGEGPGFAWRTRSNGNMGLVWISG